MLRAVCNRVKSRLRFGYKINFTDKFAALKKTLNRERSAPS